MVPGSGCGHPPQGSVLGTILSGTGRHWACSVCSEQGLEHLSRAHPASVMHLLPHKSHINTWLLSLTPSFLQLSPMFPPKQ